MPAPPWNRLCDAVADPVRARAIVETLRQHPETADFIASAPLLSARALTLLAGGSRHLAAQITRFPGWVTSLFAADVLQQVRRADTLRTQVSGILDGPMELGAHGPALRDLRHWHSREHMRIAARDLLGLADVEQITKELSDLADACLGGIYRVVKARLTSRLGEAWHKGPDQDWVQTPFCVLALGKLGGRELNYSSDVDLLFVYGQEGVLLRDPPGVRPPRTGAPGSHIYFQRLAEAFATEVSRVTEDGQFYRVDLRLRPEGDAGPLARSLDGYELYYAESGQTWERMMLLKARPIVGDRQLGDEFLETIQPFRHPRFIAERLLDDIAQVKRRLEAEAVEGSTHRDVKRGRGGIREIEFTVQALQLLHAGRQPFLQQTSTLSALRSLAQYELLDRAECTRLGDAYCFWRTVEHRLQMDENRQTHAMPGEGPGLTRLALMTGNSDVPGFLRLCDHHAQAVRQVYDRMLGSRIAADPAPTLPPFTPGGARAWEAKLGALGFRDPSTAAKRLRGMVLGPEWSHVSARTESLGRALLPTLLAMCPGGAPPASPERAARQTLSDPDRVIARLDRFVQAYRSRAPLFEAWASNPQFFELMVLLFDRSEALGEVAIRTPDLVDEIVGRGHLRRSQPVQGILRDLALGEHESDQRRWIQRYRRAETLRIGLRSLLGLATPDQTLAELSGLAEGCTKHAMLVLQATHRLRSPPFAIVALGRFGGAELSFGSDLDLMFVAPDSCRELDRASQLATEFIALLSTHTDHGGGFVVDTRLRPDGEKGMLVNTVSAYLDYYRNRAQLWEIQALVRARPVGGHAAAADRFIRGTLRLTNFSGGNPGIAAWSPSWASEIDRMLGRIHRERTPPARRHLSLKTGEGGLAAAEFLAQKWRLSKGGRETNTRRMLQDWARSRGDSDAIAEALLDAFDELRRIELILRRWSCAPEESLPDDAPALDRVAVRCGFRSGAQLMDAVQAARQAVLEGLRPPIGI